MIIIPENLIKEIQARKTTNVLLIGIDGCGGAGKSTFATELAAALIDSQIIHIDDFYKPKEKRITITETTPVHSNFEFDRLIDEVILPISKNTLATYHTPLGETMTAKPEGYILYEGLGTLGPVLREYFDYRIWIESPHNLRRERGINRDTEQWTKIWDEEYLPQDTRYVREHSPQKYANWELLNL